MIKDKHIRSDSMGLLSATSIGVGAMIGAGIFSLMGIAVDIAGKLAWLSFLIAGIVALLTSYSVSKLAVRYPNKGGRVKFINTAFGKGIFSGTMNITMWLGYIIVTSLYARAFAEYGVALTGHREESYMVYLMSSGIVILFLMINFIGASFVGKSELLIVAVKVAILLLFGIIGITTVDISEVVNTENSGFSSIILASGIVFMSYEGFGLVANTAEDVNNPMKNLPKALFLSILIVIFIYVLVSIAVIGNLPIDKIISAKEYVLAETARPLLGTFGFTAMGIAALFSTASAINATIYGPVNMVQETAKAKELPEFFTKPLFGHQSGVSLLITGALVLIISNLLNLEAIAETGSMIFLMIYTVVNIANLRLREKTESNLLLIWLGITGTIFSSIALLYFLVIDSSLSIWVITGIIILSFLYSTIKQKL